ncbi:MAG TPA: hypothetical protein VKY19_09645 [Ktedonosporobacter sp.]|nr:hypothetical protein [Ktedonosporobacter sp.]
MLAEQSEALEKSLWAALKPFDEKVSLSRRMAEQARKSGREWLARHKTATILRRISRRITVTYQRSIREYAAYGCGGH